MPTCIVCESTNAEHLKVAPHQEASNWYECGGCGVAYRWPLPGPEEYVKYYTDDYRPVGYPSLHDRSVQLHRADRIIPLVRKVGAVPTRMLDYGCANGVLLEECRKEFGCEVVGVELNPFDQQKAAERGIEIHPTIETVQGPFDVVSMIHVVEHLTDPVGFLGQLLGLTVPDGWLLLEVPHYEAVSAWAGAHMTVWRPDVLAEAVNRSGWHVHSAWKANELRIVWLFARKAPG